MKSGVICCAMFAAACSPAQRQTSEMLNAVPQLDSGAMNCELDLGGSKRYLRLYWGINYAGAKYVDPDENKETEFWILNQDRFLIISDDQRHEVGNISSALKFAGGMVDFLFEYVPPTLKADMDAVVEMVPSLSEIPVAMIMEVSPVWTEGKWQMIHGLKWGDGIEKLVLPQSWDGAVGGAPFLLQARTADLVDSSRKNDALASALWENGPEKAALKCDGMSELGRGFLATKTEEIDALPLTSSSQELNVSSTVISSLVSRLAKNRKASALAHVLVGAACYPNFQAWQQKFPAVTLSDEEKRQLAEAIRVSFFQELEKQDYSPWLGYIENAGGSDAKQILMAASQAMCVDSYIRALDQMGVSSRDSETL